MREPTRTHGYSGHPNCLGQHEHQGGRLTDDFVVDPLCQKFGLPNLHDLRERQVRTPFRLACL